MIKAELRLGIEGIYAMLRACEHAGGAGFEAFTQPESLPTARMGGGDGLPRA